MMNEDSSNGLDDFYKIIFKMFAFLPEKKTLKNWKKLDKNIKLVQFNHGKIIILDMNN